jgi:radical SAM protein with 4Fe4S-binding SPASM domain
MLDREVARFLFLPTRRNPPAPIPQGLFHYMREVDGTVTRFHLRVDPDGRGMLMANASAAARLSPVGVRMAKGLLDGLPKDEILNDTRQRFRGATRSTMENDYLLVEELIVSLALPGDNYPIINLEDPEISPYDIELMAPWQADIPLAMPQETTLILDRLWQIGIPHVTIFAPPGLNPEHLVRTIERAEDLGMIAGVRARATDLKIPGLLDDMSMAGIDHITLLYASNTPELHDDLAGNEDLVQVWPLFAAMLEREIAPVAEMPLTRRTLAGVESSLLSLLEAQVHNVNFVAYAMPDELASVGNDDFLPASSMPQVADIVEETASELDVRFIWQPPVGGDPMVPISEQIIRGPRCSDDASIRVEANGDVIPPRGAFRVAGNLLTDDWEQIWANSAFIRYRERVEKPTRCDECPGMAICAADCPRYVSGWSTTSGGYDR